MELYKQELLGIVCSFLIASTAYADGTSTTVHVGKKGFIKEKDSHDVKVGVDSSLKKTDVSTDLPAFSGLRDVDWSILGHKVSSISFVGEKNVPTAMFTQDMLAKTGSSLKYDDVVHDMNLVYMSGFYKDVKLRSSFQEDGSVNLYYEVAEYPLLKGVEIYGTKLLDPARFANSLGVPVGQVINFKTIGKTLSDLTDLMRKNGYLLFNLVSVQLSEDGYLKIGFTDGIVEGFEFVGNNHTKEFVIRRELLQAVNSPLNSILLQNSGKRLYGLGIFDTVDFQLVPSPENPERVRVRVIVEEGNNATVGLGAGYSDIDGTVGQFTIEDKNLFGRNHHTRFTWEVGRQSKKNYSFMYRMPYLDKKGTSVQLDIYDSTKESAEYGHSGVEVARFNKRSIGQQLTFSRADSNVTRNYITLKNQKDSYREMVNKSNYQYFESSFDPIFYKLYGYATTAEERRKANFGTTRSITVSRVYDNRDSADFPTRGKRNEYSFELAGFGGDFSFQKLAVDYRYYWPCGEKGKHTLALNLGAGYSWGEVPLSQRFAVGGSDSLRGYESNQFRGYSMLKGSLEYRVPVSKKFSVLAFLDTGYAWDSRMEGERNFDLRKMKVGYGIGVRVKTPIGAVKLDYGFGKREEGQSYRGRFHFSFGGSF